MNTNRNFRRREPLRKIIACSCGMNAKLSKRRNFPHGVKSKGRIRIMYRCVNCRKESPIKKVQEVRR